MTALRRLLLAHRAAALWLFAAALLARVLIPAGYMIASTGGEVTVTLCSGSGPMTMTMPMPSDRDHGGDRHGAEPPCAFAGLAAPALAAADPILLAIAIAFIVAIALRPTPISRVEPRSRLRPPLRGPPVTA